MRARTCERESVVQSTVQETGEFTIRYLQKGLVRDFGLMFHLEPEPSYWEGAKLWTLVHWRKDNRGVRNED